MELKIKSPVSENLKPTGDPGYYLIYCSYLLLYLTLSQTSYVGPQCMKEKKGAALSREVAGGSGALTNAVGTCDFGPVLSFDRVWGATAIQCGAQGHPAVSAQAEVWAQDFWLLVYALPAVDGLACAAG